MRPTIKNQLVALSDALRPDGIMCVESTALGYNNFSDLWFSAQKEHSTWTPLFFSWLQDFTMNKTKYENATRRYMNRHNISRPPTFDELGLDDEEISLVDRGMSVEQCLWRREYIDDRGIDAFHQEQPDSPLRAFVSTGNNVFDTSLLNEKLNELHKYPILTRYPKELAENKILKPYCNLRFKNPKLKVWRIPKNKDEMFFLGVDTSDGLSGNHDYSVISVWDENCIQVAEFRDNGTKPFKFADIVELVGTFYNHGLLVIERNASGNTVAEKLSSKLTLAGKPYPNLYRQKDLDNKKSKVGFTTSVRTKSQIVTYFQNMFDDDDLLIKSKDLLTEMQLYIGKGDGKTEASIGFDDCVMAGCFALAGWKDRSKQYKRAFSAGSIIRRGLF